MLSCYGAAGASAHLFPRERSALWAGRKDFVSTALTHQASPYTGTQNSCAFAQWLTLGAENCFLTVGQGLKTHCIDVTSSLTKSCFMGSEP